ncbi:MAG: hypothetical protein JW888_10340 [Pirellulales bacterium]|nr:hypothetical protein [Pirellulales bacterium]
MTFSHAVLAAHGVTRTVFEWGRIQSNSDWIGPVAVAVAVMLLARLIYRKDACELSPTLGWILTLLRTVVILALLVLYLQPQWRTEQERRINSRALVLVDHSLSMGLADSSTGGATRGDQVVESFEKSRLVERLRAKHDVSVFRFGEKLEPLLTLERIEKPTGEETERVDASSPGKVAKEPAETISWKKMLTPSASQTRLGEALGQLIDQQRDAPVSGVIVITDGCQNAGAAPETSLATASEARIPVFPVGVGSDQEPANVRVSDFVVPTRAYPGDQYAVTGYLQTRGLAGQGVTVELLSKAAGEGMATPGEGDLVESRDVILGEDGEVLPVRFELSPDEPGRQTLTLRVKAPAADRNPADNRREADVEIVDRKSRVLLLAGGPMREYRFLRSLLYRDKSVAVDVLLQTAQAGMSQEADKVLDDFPATREAMYEYDSVVALDPDWQALGEEQIALLEDWVAEQGGGLIVAAGAVNMGNSISGWIQDDRMAKIRALYPVTFARRFATDASSYASSEPWPLDFTREGLEAEFLWLGDDEAASQQAWAEFAGVYGYYPVEGAKPGATVLARFSDPRVGSSEKRPVYAAVHFFGTGRVLYLGSAELWRLREVDETHFETVYTKLLRHVSQGRLLRGSSRGALLVDRDRYMLGGTVEVRAQLTDTRLEPLAAESVAMQVFQPGGTVRMVELRGDADRPGTFAGRFTVLEEGAWRLELPIPQSDDERLSRRIQVKMPDVERENSERNDPLLAKIAKATGGRYYVGVARAFSGPDSRNVIDQLKDRTKTVILTGAPNRSWQESWLRWFMIFACGVLFVEWLIRRIVKLA